MQKTLDQPCKLIAFGDANVDLVTEIPLTASCSDAVPRPEARLFGGGTIGNTAAGTARLGIETSFLGKVGLDGYGRFLKEGFEADGVDTSFLIEDPDHFTVMVLAFIDASGDKHNVTFPAAGGAHLNITIPEIDSEVWTGAGWFHTSGMALGEEPSRQTALYLMRSARDRGLIVSFDLNLRLEYFGWRDGAKESVLEAMALSDVIFASIDEELQPLTGKQNFQDVITALAKLYPVAPPCISPEQQIIIGRQGGDPAKVWDRGTTFLSPGFQVDIVDALGAGDAFNSGFIAARLNGKNLEESLLQAHGTAGFNLTRKGARGMPREDQLLEFISSHKRKV